jgi:hypothetical protein
MITNDILIIDSVTKFGDTPQGRVAIAASHGGVYAGYLAARAGIRGVILHDAGIGRDKAGITSLPYLDDLRIAGATIDYRSARIGDGAAMAATGIVSHVNGTARLAGCAVGQLAMETALAMQTAPGGDRAVPQYDEARFVLLGTPGKPTVIGCDSTSLVRPEDVGQIVITASHGDLLKEAPSWGNRPDVRAAVFNDAGANNPTRLPDLDTRAIAAATVSTGSARIGDARSTYEDGVISHVNATAAAHGAAPGMTCIAFVELMREVSALRRALL